MREGKPQLRPVNDLFGNEGSMATLAAEIFLAIVDRRDELRRLAVAALPLALPWAADELRVVEELVEALAGSNDGPALERHLAELSHSALKPFLH